MAFKDEVENDISLVFLNAEEFAEEHVIDGVKVLCVVTQESDVDTLKDGRLHANIEADMVVRGRERDLYYDTHGVVNVDGREYFVQKVETNQGMTDLYLSQRHQM